MPRQSRSRSGPTTPTRGPRPRSPLSSPTAASKSSEQVTVNTVDRNTFQNNISSYLQGTPDALFTWFAGYRLQFFAAQGSAEPARRRLGEDRQQLQDAAKSLSTGIDGHYYLVPLYNYPWVVFYNKSVFATQGLRRSDHLGRLHRAGEADEGDKLIPLAFADKDGWPALGTFDILNLRINGYRPPHQADETRGAVDRPGCRRGLQPVA